MTMAAGMCEKDCFAPRRARYLVGRVRFRWLPGSQVSPLSSHGEVGRVHLR